MLNPSKNYHRQNQILYGESGTEIIKFLDKTPDRNDLTGDLIVNMNNYIRCYPERIEIIEPKNNVQLNLF